MKKKKKMKNFKSLSKHTQIKYPTIFKKSINLYICKNSSLLHSFNLNGNHHLSFEKRCFHLSRSLSDDAKKGFEKSESVYEELALQILEGKESVKESASKLEKIISNESKTGIEYASQLFSKLWLSSSSQEKERYSQLIMLVLYGNKPHNQTNFEQLNGGKILEGMMKTETSRWDVDKVFRLLKSIEESRKSLLGDDQETPETANKRAIYLGSLISEVSYPFERVVNEFYLKLIKKIITGGNFFRQLKDSQSDKSSYDCEFVGYLIGSSFHKLVSQMTNKECGEQLQIITELCLTQINHGVGDNLSDDDLTTFKAICISEVSRCSGETDSLWINALMNHLSSKMDKKIIPLFIEKTTLLISHNQSTKRKSWIKNLFNF